MKAEEVVGSRRHLPTKMSTISPRHSTFLCFYASCVGLLLTDCNNIEALIVILHELTTYGWNHSKNNNAAAQ